MEKTKLFIDKAYNKAKESDSKDMRRDVLFLLCDFYLATKNFVEFRKTMEILQRLVKGVKSKRFESNISLLLGRYYTETNDFEKANKHLNKALKIFEEIGERLNIGKANYYMAIMKLAMGKKSLGRKRLTKASEIFESLGAKGWKEKVEKTLKNFK
ncbi:MAG: tetratricopeptide repeat protein [bacterium]